MFPHPRRPGLYRLLAVLALAAVLASGLPAGLASAQSPTQFTDIRGHWAEPFILAAQAAGVITVPDDGRFRPDDPTTRLDFAVWMARALELQPVTPAKPPFTDWNSVPSEDRGLVAAAVQAGVLKGYPNGTFQPNRTLNRAEMGVIFGRALEKLGVTPESRYFYEFGDHDAIPGWAAEASAAVKEGIILGRPSQPGQLALYAPFATTTRAETVTMLVRFMNVRFQLLGIQPAPKPAPQPAGTIVTGWATAQDLASLNLGADRISWVIASGYTVDSSTGGAGALVGADSPALFQWARDHQKPLLVRVSLMGGPAIHTVLANPQTQARLVQNIMTVVGHGYGGVNLDFEYLQNADRDLFTQFATALAQQLHAQNLLLTIDLPWRDQASANSWGHDFDFAALGRVADYLIIMTYDQHYATSGPGPVGSIPWMQQGLGWAVSQAPAQKILLGIPAYAYDWAKGEPTRAWYIEGALNLIARYHAQPIVHTDLGETQFFYTDSQGVRHEVWFTDTSGLAAKLALVQQFHLAGAAIWKFGYETPDWWGVIRQALP
ncbi:MAG: S-layer homology domain-containing protein [Bacillota bacterium]|nr:S-layer homology domain-containing protein [Bacillota bacterium]